MLDFLALGYWVEIYLLSSAFPRMEEAMEEALGSSIRILMWDIDGNDRARTQVRLFFLYVKAAVPMICGAIGLWGVFASHARAAEWYLWTWLPRLLLFVLAETTRWPVAHTFLYLLWLFMIAFRLFKLLYYIKVVWSYQEVLKRRIYRAPP